MRLFRRNRGLTELDEAAAYARTLPEKEITIVKLPPRRARNKDVLAAGDLLRRAFVDRLERRNHDDEEGPRS